MGAARKPKGSHGECSVVGCRYDARTRGWCNKHYGRWLRHGDPEFVKQIRGDHVSRWWSKVQQSQACWLWLGTILDSGYGSFWNGEREVGAHVYGYELIVGSIPDDAELDHVCRNRACVKPTHLEPVSHALNVQRSIKNLCRKGHPLVPGNVYRMPKSGARLCITCNPNRRPNWFPG